MSGVTMRMAEIRTQIAAMNPAARAATTTSTSGTTFADALASALGTTGANGTSGTTGTTGTTGVGQLNSDGIPVSLAAYGNGKIPGNQLTEVGNTGHKLWAPAATSLTSLLQAAARDGVKIGITDSYRSYDEQVDLARRKGLYSQGGLAAKPGTSDHGWGMAVDLDLDSKAQAWMRANGAKYGFVEDTPREPWHWGFKPKS